MKVTKPAEEIEVCDICHRDAYLQTCIVCGGRYCLTHQAIIPGCWVKPIVGRCCQDRDDVQAIVARFSERITPMIEARAVALRALRG